MASKRLQKLLGTAGEKPKLEKFDLTQLIESYIEQAITKEGKQGRQGNKGDKGERGFGIDRVWKDGETIYVKYEDGDTRIVGYVKDGVDGKDGISPDIETIAQRVWQNSRRKLEDFIRENIPAPLVGPVGPKGDAGDPPKHEVKNNKIRFENPDGSWGAWIELPKNATPSSVEIIRNGLTKLSQLKDVDLSNLTTTNGKYVLGSGSGGGTAAWGSITGTLSDQTDLQTVLDTIPDSTSDLTNDSGFITDLSSFDTGDLTEGSNLYFTNARADARITAQKGSASGLAPLNSSSKIDTMYLPALALADVYSVSSEATQLALTAQEGDVAIRSDLNKSYIHNGGTAGTMADWSELLTPTDAVLSVNGQTGAVVLGTLSTLDDLSTFDTDDLTVGTVNLYSQFSNISGGISYNGGNVGIGTNLPTHPLDVYGNSGKTILGVGDTITTADGTNPAIYIQADADNGLTSFNSRYNHSFSILVDNTERMRVDTDGNVGIGTTSPGAKLDVNGTIFSKGLKINSAYTLPTSDGTADQVLQTDGSGAVSWATVASGTSDLVDDTSPQLGGDLDLNSHTVGDATAADLTKLHAVTASATELNLLDGITTLSGSNTGDQTTITGNAGSATKLATARTIAGVSFDGSASISLDNNAITNGAGYITNTLTGSSSINTGTFNLLSGVVTYTPTTADFDGNIEALDFTVRNENGGTTAGDSGASGEVGYLRGGRIEALQRSNATINDIYGLTAMASTSATSSGDVTFAYGSHGLISHSGSGTIGTVYSNFSETYLDGDGGVDLAIAYYGDASAEGTGVITKHITIANKELQDAGIATNQYGAILFGKSRFGNDYADPTHYLEVAGDLDISDNSIDSTIATLSFNGLRAFYDDGNGFIKINPEGDFGSGSIYYGQFHQWVGDDAYFGSFGSAGTKGNVAILSATNDEVRRITIDGGLGTIKLVATSTSDIDGLNIDAESSGIAAIGDLNGAYVLSKHSSTGLATNINGIYGYARNNSAGGATSLRAIYAYGRNDSSTGTVGELYGTFGVAWNHAGGSVTDLYGGASFANNNGTGTVTRAYGYYAYTQNNSTGTITDSYAMYLGDVYNPNGGTVTTNYGLYIEDIDSGATNYSIKTGAGDVSFGGNVGVNTDTPAAKGYGEIFSVYGKSYFDDYIFVQALDVRRDSGNPTQKFSEGSTLRAQVYYDVTNNRLTFDNAENNNADAIYFKDKSTFADDVTFSGSVSLGGDLNAGANTIYFTETDNGSSSTADTVDWGVGNKQKSTLTGNCTFTFTAPAGPCNLVLKLIQDATGSRTVTWPSTVKWAGGTAPTLSTAASAVDIVSFYYDGSSYYGMASTNFS